MTTKTKHAPSETGTLPDAPQTAPGADLIPRDLGGRKGVAERRWYWVGALPSMPRTFVELGGVTFTMMTETVHVAGQEGASRRDPHVGSLQHLTEDQISNIKEALRNSVVRFTEPAPEPSPSFEGQGVEVLHGETFRLRKGHPLRILSDAEIEQREEAKTPFNRYTPQDFDEPMAHHVFAVECADQKHPRCNSSYPEPVSKTGLEWRK